MPIFEAGLLVSVGDNLNFSSTTFSERTARIFRLVWGTQVVYHLQEIKFTILCFSRTALTPMQVPIRGYNGLLRVFLYKQFPNTDDSSRFMQETS